MIAPDTNNKRIAKNTIILYFRMFLVLLIGLFTSRVVLNTLGVEDYGIYNVVGGFVLIFGFLNGAMSTATQRFITVELARGNLKKQIITFSTAINIHIIIAIIIAILAETIGLWLFYNKMIIPSDRITAAFWVYQLSIATAILNFISVPYNALINAHEKMSAFAYISIMDVVLKLIIVFCLTIVSVDKLIFYATLLFLVQVLDRIIYGVYCSRNFEEAHYIPVFNKAIFKDMLNIAGWSLFGNIASVSYTYGLNIILNIFWGPTVNAARGIAVTVQGVVSGFVGNVQMAMNPQITKSYAVNNISRMHSLIYTSSKACFYLLFIITLPIIVETNEILTLWLKNVPDHTVWFTRIILCIMLVDTLANPLMVSAQAVGKVRKYQSIVGGCLMLILPISYICLKLGSKPESVFIVQFIMSVIATIFRVVIVSKLITMSILKYIKNVFIHIVVVSICSATIAVLIHNFLNDTLTANIITAILIIIITCCFILCFGLNSYERNFIMSEIKKRFK